MKRDVLATAAARLREHGDHALTRGEMSAKAAAALLLRCGCTCIADIYENGPHARVMAVCAYPTGEADLLGEDGS